MKSSVQKFRPELERLMKEAREAIAGERFDPVRVKGEMSAAAKGGLSFCVLQVAGEVDLRKTSAAISLLSWCDNEGLRAEWVRRPLSNSGEAAWDLMLSWKTKQSV